MLRPIIHYGIHFLLPFVVGYLFFPKNRKWAILILLSAILIDVDHLWASPIFDAQRCSINFHPLHSYWAISVYAALLLFQKTRIFGLALMLHILADAMDCYLLKLGFD